MKNFLLLILSIVAFSELYATVDCTPMNLISSDENSLVFGLPTSPNCGTPLEYNYTFSISDDGGVTYIPLNNFSITFPNGSPQISIPNLEPCTDYTFIVDVFCNGNLEGGCVNGMPFTTGGCVDDPIEHDLDCGVVNTTNDTGYISYTPINDPACETPYYNIGWKEAGANNWNYCCTSDNLNGSAQIWGLDPCTDYEFVVELKCEGGYQGETVVECTGTFTTAGCAPIVHDLDCGVVNTTNDTGYISYTPINDPACETPYYNIGWKEAGANNWNYCCTSDNLNGSAQIWGLDPCTDYEFVVELKCEGGYQGETVVECTGTFTTAGCAPIVHDLDCGVVNTTNDTGYISYTPINDPACETPYYNIGWKEAGANNWNYCCTSDNLNGSAQIWGLDPCTDYEFVVELKCEGGYQGETVVECTGTFTTAGCTPIVHDLDCGVVNTTNDTGYISYTPINDPACETPYYNIGWKEAGANNWNYCCTSDNLNGSAQIWGLDPCTDYEFVVELKCEGGYQGETVVECTGTFTTAGCTPIIHDLDCGVVNTSRNKGYISYTPINDPACTTPYYNIGWKKAGANNWNYCCTSDNLNGSAQIWGLSPCTDYEFVVELKCEGGFQGETVTECTGTFKTKCLVISTPTIGIISESPWPVSGGKPIPIKGGGGKKANNTGFEDAFNHTLNIYPNPAKDIVNVSINSELADYISVIDVTGKKVIIQKVDANSDTSIDISNLHIGVYFIKTTNINGDIEVKQFIKVE